MTTPLTSWRDECDQPQSRVLLDSVSEAGVRLTTLEVTMHRFVLAEFNTHRVFSRNSASSRAIPFAKQVAKVRNAPALPVEWRAEQSGMQGGDLLTGADAAGVEEYWRSAASGAVAAAHGLAAIGAHKSIVNRILEPFLWHNVIVSSTEWAGFWEQRCSPYAQPEIRVAAEAMRAAYEASEPTEVGHDDWHTPLILPEENDDYWASEYRSLAGRGGAAAVLDAVPVSRQGLEMRKRVSAARCARVSYLTHDGLRSPEKDLDLYVRLVTANPGHWSPFEHVARPCDPVRHDLRFMPHPGNFRGWDQFRHYISSGENS